MSSRRDIHFRLGASRAVAALALLMAAGGVVLPLVAGAPGWLVGTCAVGVASIAGMEWRMQVRRSSPRAVVALGRDAAGDWWLRTRGGPPVGVTLERAWVVPCLVVLGCRCSLRRHAVVVAPDALEGDEFRRLCRLLRCAPWSASSAPDRA